MLIIVISMISTTTSVLAWRPLSAKWGSINPLYYYINCGSPSSDAWSLSTSIWNDSGTPAYFTSNIVLYKVYLSAYAAAPGGWDGITYTTKWGMIVLNTSSYLDTCNTDSYLYAERLSVSSHELGHVLNLDEETNPANVLMQPGTNIRYGVYGIYTPQQDDINGVNYMYLILKKL